MIKNPNNCTYTLQQYCTQAQAPAEWGLVEPVWMMEVVHHTEERWLLPDRWHWGVFCRTTQSRMAANRHRDSVLKTLFLYSTSPAKLAFTPSGPSPELPGDHINCCHHLWLHACPSGSSRTHTPTNIVENTHTLRTSAWRIHWLHCSPVFKIQKKKEKNTNMHVRRRDTFCINPFVELLEQDLLEPHAGSSR